LGPKKTAHKRFRGGLDQFIQCPLLDDSSFGQQHDPVAEKRCFCQVMRHHDNRFLYRPENRAEVVGTRGTIRVEDETLILADGRGERRWTFEQPLSQGSYHPEWFCQVREDFLSEISGGTQKGENLVMASRCVQLVQLAKESHGRGGQPLALR